MHSPETGKAEELLKKVLHDLRQPLGVLEIAAYLINRKLSEGRPLDRDEILCLERQVERAACIVAGAAAQLERLHDQPACADGPDVTDSETALVT